MKELNIIDKKCLILFFASFGETIDKDFGKELDVC